MAQPNRYYQQQQHQQHQQRPSAEEGPIPFFAGAGNPPRPAPLQHQTRPAFVYQQPQPQQRPPLQQQQQQPPRPPQFQRHPQQHPRPPPQPPVQQHNRPHPLAQQHQRPPPAPTSQPSNTELAPAANLFANPPVAITQSPNRPPRPQGYQASTSNDFVQQDESTQSSRQGSHAQQPRPPVQRQGQPLQRHPHHPVPAIQPASNEATAFGSTADLFGGPGHPSPISNTSAPLLQQGPAPVPGGSRPSSRPPLPMGSLQKRPSLTPSQQPASTPPPPQQRPILSNRQQQSPLPAQAQRFSPSPYGVQQQPATPYQQPSTSSPRLHRLGSVSSVHSGSPHTTHVLPKTPLMSAVQPSPLPQGQPSTPSFPPTSYTGGQESPRVSTPQVILQPCPFSECSGENKPQAKFCSECGRPISLASQSATPMLGPRTEHPSVQASPMPSQDHTHSFSQEYGQYQPQTAQHQEYYNNGGYDYQHQQQQQYDPSTENYSENYLQPQDQSAPEQQPQVTEPERINDPLNRHLGCPLIAFGFGGKVTTWFAQGNGALGPLKMQRISDVIPKDTAIASYPGPLLMDSSVQLMAKRNHVMKFVEDKINEFSQSPDGHVHDAHRVLVWKLLKVMLEQEGTLTGGTRIDEAVRGVLRSIPLTNLPQEAVQQKTSEQETASTDALQELLRQGDLAASIRYAIDSRLWAHALVLSSHGDRELWNEAVSGFMNQELSAASGHANGRESMRVLYTLLSGQSERAVSQLVPQNLRTQYLETKDDLSKRVEIPDQSLTQWRDTLILILSNRTEGDQGTINALGNLLRKEGWVEAAHICYLLSPQVSVHSGSDDSNSSMVLLGVENDPHAAYPFYGNVSAFQKTEIYEFGRALKSSGATGGLPFFQAYKLIYSWRLLDVGMLSEAARYLESMENIMKSQTKGSPYYNSTLFAQLKELTERMAASVHNAGPWLSKKVPSPVVGSIFDGSEKTSVESDTSSHDHASRGIAETEVFSVEQRADVDSVFARETSAVTQEQTGQHSDATHGFDTLVQQQHDFGHQHQDAGYHDATQDQAYNQQHVSPFTSEHHSETTAVPSMLSTQAVAGSENLSPNDLHETAPDHQIQDAGFDGSYSQYPSNPGYDQQDGAAYGNHEYQGQHQHLQHDDGSHGHAYGETLTYESTQYPPQEDPYNQAQSTNAVDELFGTGYNEASTQVLPEHYPAEDLSQQQVAHEHEPTHVDTTTTSEQPVAQLQTENSTETGQHYWTQDQSYQHGEATHGEGHAVEGQDNSHGGPDHGQAAYHEQQGLEYDQHKDTEFQQQHQAGYQHGDYQQGGEHQQGEYQQGEHQQGEYQQGEYQQGEYQQGEYQQGEYHQGEYQQDGYQQGEYQQGDYQQGDYQQSGYQQGEYQQSEYQQGDYQQGDYQQPDYQQGEHQQGGYQYGNNQQEDYQQGDHQQGDYQQGNFQQEGHHQGEHQHAEYQPDHHHQQGELQEGQYQQYQQSSQPQTDHQAHGYYQQSSTEPGVLPVSSDGDSNTHEYQPVTDVQGIQNLPEGDYEEGQFISFGAVPSFQGYGGQQRSEQTTPQPQLHGQGGTEESVDDLGLGNTCQNDRSVPAASNEGPGATGDHQPADNSSQGAQPAGEANAGWWPNIFGGERREPTPPRANVAQGSSFYYDNEQRRWINRDAPESDGRLEPLPPPPKSRTPASPSIGSGAANASPGHPASPPVAGGPPQARPGSGATVRRGARARYVDVLNP